MSSATPRLRASSPSGPASWAPRWPASTVSCATPSRRSTRIWRNTIGTPPTGSSALGMRSPVIAWARVPRPPAMITACIVLEPVRLDALDRVADRIGRMAPRRPAERLQARDVVAELRHVAGPATVAAGVADLCIRTAGRRQHDPGDLAHRGLADPGGVIDRKRAGGFFAGEQDRVDQ